MDKKRYGSQMRGNGEGYQGSGGSIEVTQGKLGLGMCKPKHSKAPIYHVQGRVEKIMHGHQDVEDKI